MSPQWLERLNRALEYPELHVVFSEIAADSRATPHDPELAKCIDEAIHRIQQESLRDEDILETVEQAYDAFRHQQRGFFGWLRRHLPFTKTRRVEKQHTLAVSDQQAQLLADQLIIARAQMIKEQLLPPETRRLGYSASVWQRRLTKCDSLAKLQDYASLVRELRVELVQSHAFIQQIDSDLNAFAQARFSDREDQRRKDADLSAARSELAVLQLETHREESLRAGAIERMGSIVSDELNTHDANYRSLIHRIALLETATHCAQRAKESFAELHSKIKSMCDSADELGSIPGQRDKLIEQSRRIERDTDDVQRRHAQAAADQNEHAHRFDIAKDEFERAQAGVEAAKGVYEAYLAEAGYAERPPDDSSAVAAENTRQQEILRDAESVLRMVAAPHEAAKAKRQRVEQEFDGLKKKLADMRREEDSLEQRSHRLRADLDSAYVQLLRKTEHADRNADKYLESLRPMNRDELLQEMDRIMPNRSWGSSRLAPASCNHRDLKQSQERYVAVLRHLGDVCKSLNQDFSNDQGQRHSIWTRRCAELLGDDLTAEICQS